MQLKESIKHYYDGCLFNSLLDFPKMDSVRSIEKCSLKTAIMTFLTIC